MQIEYNRQVREVAEELSSGMVQTSVPLQGNNHEVDASSQHSYAALRNMFMHHTHCKNSAKGGPRCEAQLLSRGRVP